MKQLYVLIVLCFVILRGECQDEWVYTNPQEWEQQKPNSRNENGNYYQIGNGFSTQFIGPSQNYDNINDQNSNGQYNRQISNNPVAYNNQQYTRLNYPEVASTKQKGNDYNTIVTGQGLIASAGIGQFGLKMLQITNQRKNVVLSPYSITTVLGLLQQGSRGQTLQQISSALQMPAEVTAAAFQQLTDSLRARSSGQNILNVANNIFTAAGFSLNQDFENKARVNFGSEVTPLDFSDSSRAVQTINKWVSRATNNKINQLMAPGSVNGNTQLVLVNAIHFKGVWKSKFRAEATLPRDFLVNGVPKKSVQFMRARKNYKYEEDASSQILVLPFENEEYSLTIILPSPRTSVSAILSNLSYDKLAYYQGLEECEVDLEIPKFSLKADTDLHPLLQQMGITKMFGPSSELYGIVNEGYSSPQVTSAIHSAMLSIDEEGGTASAATAFKVVALSYGVPDAVMKINRPFLAVLWDTKLALPLIMAKIEDPTL